VHGRTFHRAEELFERLHLDLPAVLRAGLGLRVLAEDPLTWDDLEALDADLALRVRAKAASYGYAT
jgi:hypothetical protein